jgi:hypothetical protein
VFLAILRRFPAGVGPSIETALTIGVFAVFVMLWAGVAYSLVRRSGPPWPRMDLAQRT